MPKSDVMMLQYSITLRTLRIGYTMVHLEQQAFPWSDD